MDLRVLTAKLPDECALFIWKHVFDDVVATINLVKPTISWKKNKSKNLKLLLQNEIGAYQPGYADFDKTPFYCILCAHENFPCEKCHRIYPNIECGIFHYDFDSSWEDHYYDWEDPFNYDYY
jgi:hypothetical protein